MSRARVLLLAKYIQPLLSAGRKQEEISKSCVPRRRQGSSSIHVITSVVKSMATVIFPAPGWRAWRWAAPPARCPMAGARAPPPCPSSPGPLPAYGEHVTLPTEMRAQKKTP